MLPEIHPGRLSANASAQPTIRNETTVPATHTTPPTVRMLECRNSDPSDLMRRFPNNHHG